jgi:phosphoglucosamine mutase
MLFGSSGVRGLANQDITPDLALQIGRACGMLYKSIVVGHDPRMTSPLLHHALIAGAIATGATVTNVGLVSTPTLSHAAANHDIGVMVTASHNPAPYNGFKLFNHSGDGFSLQQSKEIEEALDAPLADWHSVGRCEFYESAIQTHIGAILDAMPGLQASPKVVVDCANGTTGTITPFLMEKMGCEVITLNAQPDGFFPAHNPEPTLGNLSQLQETVLASQADLGIAHDCDGDRMIAVTQNGRSIPSDALLALMARTVNEHGTIVVPVNTSRLVDDTLPNATIKRTRVGDIFISQKLKEIRGDFGGEPSGTYVFPSFSYCPDGIFAAAFLVHLTTEIDLTEEASSLPGYHTLRESLPVDKITMASGMAAVEQSLVSLDYQNFTAIDGIRIDFDNAWALVRPSGTEPKIRVTVEARRQDDARTLFEKVMSIVKRSFV